MVDGWPVAAWRRLTVSEGEQGPITYDWAAARVVESRHGLPGGDVWLLARRSLSDPCEVAYYLSNAPRETALLDLAQVASRRYSIEQCFEEGKGEVGLDHYEVRYWHSWHGPPVALERKLPIRSVPLPRMPGGDVCDKCSYRQRRAARTPPTFTISGARARL